MDARLKAALLLACVTWVAVAPLAIGRLTWDAAHLWAYGVYWGSCGALAAAAAFSFRGRAARGVASGVALLVALVLVWITFLDLRIVPVALAVALLALVKEAPGRPAAPAA